jgi:hypothetical protein
MESGLEESVQSRGFVSGCGWWFGEDRELGRFLASRVLVATTERARAHVVVSRLARSSLRETTRIRTATTNDDPDPPA